MPKTPETPLQVDDTERVLHEVLKAEREAREAVGRCEAQATDRLAEARGTAQRIGERADARIHAVQAHCARQRNHELAELQREEAALSDTPPPFDEAALQQAVLALAKALIGPAPEDPSKS